MQQTKWDPKPYQVGVKSPDDRESRHITSLEVWMFLDSHTWFDIPNQVNAMHVMQTWLNMQHDTKMLSTTSIMQSTWQMYNAKHTRYKHDANMDQFWPWDWYATRLNGTTMQQTWSKHARGPKAIKVQTFIHLKTAPKVLKMMDKQLKLTSKLMVLKSRHKMWQLSPTNMTSHGMIKASKIEYLHAK